MAALADNPPTPATQPKHRRLRIWLYAAAGVLLLCAAGVFGWRMYVHIREDRIVKKARDFMEKKDYGQALIAAQWALQLSPRNVSVNRIMAELADVAGSSQAVFWHRSVAELEPGVPENHLKWAEAGLRSNNLPMAEQALVGVPGEAKKTAAFHEMAARVAQASNKTAEAATHFAEAVRIEPSNDTYRFGLATARLESPEAAIHDEARSVIDQFRANSEFRQRAHRALIQDHFRRSEWREGFLLAADLQATADAPFEDRMLLLDLLRKFKRPELHSYMMDVQTFAVRKPEQVATLVGWLNRNSMALVAADWSKRLPEAVRTSNPVPEAIAESYANLRDWPRLKPLVVEGNWEYADFMRLALLARVLREEGDQLGFRSQWTAAVRAAAQRPEAIERLARFAAASNWESDSIELLWQIARGSSNQLWALKELLGRYAAKNDTRGLLNVNARILEIEPQNLVAQNNLASLSLLLNANMDRAQTLATDAYKKQPENTAIASTYAFALHLQGKTDEGLQILRSLDPDLLENPSYAAYYGVLLVSARDPSGAEKYLDLADGGRIFPEEREMVANARATLRRRGNEEVPNPKQ